MINRVLLVDDDRAVRDALGQTFELADLKPILAGSFIEAKDHISRAFPGVVVSDIRMPGKDGFALLNHARKVDPDLPVILLTGEGDIPMAVRGIGTGAFDFLEKPCAPADLLAVVEKALRARSLVLENRQMKRAAQSGDAAARMIFGRSPSAEELRDRIRTVARSAAEVLITGEPGTGIPKVAEVIHLLSPAAMRPFIKRTAGTLSPETLDAALDEAEGGTLFLDEVAALSTAAQFLLLDRLERDGDRRVIAGTHRNLSAESAEGRFHPDLRLRLEAMRVHVPALRDRPEDIPDLFLHYLAQACEQANLPVPEVPAEVIARLVAQEWPGNSRALMNAAMRFALGLSEPDSAETGLAEQMARVERSLLSEALQRHGGNATMAAQALRLPRKTFYDKLARHGIRAEDFRS